MPYPIHFAGKIKAHTESKLSFATGGIIRAFYVQEGQKVRKGTLLAQLDLTEIRAEYEKARRAYEEARWNYTRIGKLVREKVLSEASLEKARTSLQMAQSALKRAKFNLDQSSIYAYTNGIILKILMKPRERVAPGIPVLIFAAIRDNWKIETSVAPKFLSHLRIGDSFTFRLSDFPDMVLTGHLSEIAGIANPATGAFDIALKVDSIPDSFPLRSGLVGEGILYSDQKIHGFPIPYSAIIEANEEKIRVRMMSVDSIVFSVRFTPILYLDSMVIVHATPIKTKNLIVEGADYVNDGQKVIPR
jgi:RND family efflux transporter MFP subunit